MSLLAPCKDCPDRTTGDRTVDCHTTCERYAEFRAQKDAINHALKMYMEANSAAIEGRRRVKENPPSGGNKRPWRR